MIETTLLNYLDGRLTVPVRMEEPENPPESYVVLQKTGSSRTNRIRAATFAIKSYGPTLYEAAMLNADVVDLVLGMTPEDGVFGAELNSDYEFTNTTTKQYRYQAVLQIHY